jgi:hypothetical protein
MAYVNFVENNEENMSLDHEYTNDAIQLLRLQMLWQ